MGLKKWGQALAPVLFLVSAASPQDAHTLRSPDGQIEYRLFVHQAESGGLPRIAYEVTWHGKPAILTSFLGFDIVDQEPLLGENAGLMNFASGPTTMTAEYMQNGSIGRKISIEVRIANEGLIFRYVIPRTTPLFQMPVNTEITEFALPMKITPPVSTPFCAELPSAGWIAIGEQPSSGYPAMTLVRTEDNIVMTQFTKPWETTTPLTTPWRIIALGASRDQALANLRHLS